MTTYRDLENKISPGEFVYVTSRSSGPGGQNVNKVNTKVEVRLNIRLSASLTEAEKNLIIITLKNRINSAGELIVRSSSERTQAANKKKARERMLYLLSECLTEKAERRPTEPTRKSREERIDTKKKRGWLKELRSDRLKDKVD